MTASMLLSGRDRLKTEEGVIMAYNFPCPSNQLSPENLKNFQGATYILASTTMMSDRA